MERAGDREYFLGSLCRMRFSFRCLYLKRNRTCLQKHLCMIIIIVVIIVLIIIIISKYIVLINIYFT